MIDHLETEVVHSTLVPQNSTTLFYCEWSPGLQTQIFKPAYKVYLETGIHHCCSCLRHHLLSSEVLLLQALGLGLFRKVTITLCTQTWLLSKFKGW